MFVLLYVFLDRRSFIDPICCHFLHGFVHVLRLVLANFFIFSARHQLDTWTLAPQKARVWRDSVGVESSGSGLKIIVRGYFASEFFSVTPY